MDVSVLLISYNTRSLTISCIESIYKHTNGLVFEIIVVDNASTDDTIINIRAQYPEVYLISSKENIGFGRANNLAAETAKGKYLLILNTDTELRNNAIKIFFDFYENHAPENTGVIGGVLLNPDMSFGWSCNKFNTLSTILIWYYGRLFDSKRISHNLLSNRKIEDGEYLYIDYITGADIFIPKELFYRVGGFDPSIFLFYEDEDLQFRLCKMGYKNLIVGATRIVHYEGSSMQKIGGKIPIRKVIIAERSMFYYFRKIYGKPYAVWAKIVYFILVALPLRVKYTAKENKEYFLSYMKF